jgi:hypothetical protein
MNKEQIIKLWKSVGWNNTQDYHNDLIIDAQMPTKIIGDSLHPSIVNPKQFWKAADDHFFTDPICNHNNNPSNILDIEKANYNNHLIPLFLGLYGGMEFAILNVKKNLYTVKIAEIGCGYGSFEKHFINSRNDIDMYFGFDIIKRTEETIELQGEDGTFSTPQVALYEESFNIFYSCNVFQHLSEEQITKYLKQVYTMLPFDGYFVFTYVRRPDKGYTYHYGQKIEIIDIFRFKKILFDTGYEICYTYEQTPTSTSLVPIGFVIKK